MKRTSNEYGYSTKRASDIIGVTYRQVDYWARTNLVTPDIEAEGSGSRRAYSYRNLLELRVVKSLLDAGFKLESVRKAFEYLRDELEQDPSEANLVICGSESIVVKSGKQLIDLISTGQSVMNIVPLAGLKRQVDAKIVELYPEREDIAAIHSANAVENTAAAGA